MSDALKNANKAIEAMKDHNPKQYQIFKDYRDRIANGTLTAAHAKEVQQIIINLQNGR